MARTRFGLCHKDDLQVVYVIAIGSNLAGTYVLQAQEVENEQPYQFRGRDHPRWQRKYCVHSAYANSRVQDGLGFDGHLPSWFRRTGKEELQHRVIRTLTRTVTLPIL